MNAISLLTVAVLSLGTICILLVLAWMRERRRHDATRRSGEKRFEYVQHQASEADQRCERAEGDRQRFEANARRMFKLASELIDETAESYTGRPYSAGKIGVEISGLEGFSRFVNGHYIARAIHRNDAHYFVFSMNKSVLKVDDPGELSYVAIGSSGEVTVHVSERDYRQYRDRIRFDQLCASLAGIFERFFNYYTQGLEQRIIRELKTAR